MLQRERGRARRAILAAAGDYAAALESFDIGETVMGTWRQHPFDTDPGERASVPPQQAGAALRQVTGALGRMEDILDGIDEVAVTPRMAEELLSISGGSPEEFADELVNAVGERRLRHTESLGYTDEVAAFLRQGSLCADTRRDRFGYLVVDVGREAPEAGLAYLVYDSLRLYHTLNGARFHDVAKLYRDAGRNDL
ncbi:hypothetical protein [Nocardiopsis coralliicola]